MARKRKGDGTTAEDARKKRRNLPLDTNVEVLPAKPPVSNQAAPSQVISYSQRSNSLRAPQKAASSQAKSESA